MSVQLKQAESGVIAWIDRDITGPMRDFQDLVMDMVQMGKAFSILGKTAGAGMLERAQQAGLQVPPELTAPTPTH